MGYENNPRKVHGKINIVYSDSEISMDLVVRVSGKGEISYPEQVYGEYLEPSIKACTMDGNSIMGGGYQMNDHGLITGWWSDVHANEDGVFELPPWIEVSFIERPMIKWTLVGDKKLNQYPIDFDLCLYQKGNLVDTRQIRNNNKVGVSVLYEIPLAGITSIKMTIYKWSQKNAKAKMLQFFDIVEEEYLGGDLKEFEILEELCKDGDVGFGINSDSASFTIYNKDRKFDRGYLKSLVLFDRKVVPYIGVEDEEGNIKYTKFGTFYTDDWSIPQSDVWVKLKCVDKLMSLQKKVYIGFPYTEMANLYDIAEHILISSGFKNEQYCIDQNLKFDYVDKAFLQKGSSWDSLQSVCYAGLCNTYLDRNDVLTIKKEIINQLDMQINANRIISYEKHTRKTDFCNHIEVNYTEVETTSTQITAYEGNVTIDVGASKSLTVDYSGLISDAVLSILPSIGIEIMEFESGVNAGKFILKNNTNGLVSTVVKIQGFSLSAKTQTVVVNDEKSIEAWGKQEYIYESSDLVQTYERAEEIARLILSRLTEANGNVKITWRGDPGLGLQDTFITSDRFGARDKCINEYNRFKFDGGLKQDSRGRLIDGDME